MVFRIEITHELIQLQSMLPRIRCKVKTDWIQTIRRKFRIQHRQINSWKYMDALAWVPFKLSEKSFDGILCKFKCSVKRFFLPILIFIFTLDTECRTFFWGNPTKTKCSPLKCLRISVIEFIWGVNAKIWKKRNESVFR